MKPKQDPKHDADKLVRNIKRATRVWMIRLGQHPELEHHLMFLSPVSKLF